MNCFVPILEISELCTGIDVALCSFITKTHPCNILQFSTAVKIIIFRRKIVIFSYFCSKHRSWVLVRTSTYNLCFRANIRKNVYPCKPQFCYINVGCKGVYITRKCYPDVVCLCRLSMAAYALLRLCIYNYKKQQQKNSFSSG